MHAQIQEIRIMQAGRTPLQKTQQDPVRMTWEKEQENRIERTEEGGGLQHRISNPFLIKY